MIHRNVEIEALNLFWFSEYSEKNVSQHFYVSLKNETRRMCWYIDILKYWYVERSLRRISQLQSFSSFVQILLPIPVLSFFSSLHEGHFWGPYKGGWLFMAKSLLFQGIVVIALTFWASHSGIKNSEGEIALHNYLCSWVKTVWRAQIKKPVN